MRRWRPGIIYAYDCRNPNGRGRNKWAYIGKTRQALGTRHAQHMGIQPWSDLDPKVRVVFHFNSCPDWWLSFVEVNMIKLFRPTYNYEHNTRNSRRIPKYVAAKQRKDRDRAAKKVAQPWKIW